MITGWRLVKRRYASNAFSGEGARRYGSRWTSPGRPAVFLSEHLSLAALEVLVHAHDETLLAAYHAFRVELDEAQVEPLSPAALPEEWAASPVAPAVRMAGDRWLQEGRALALRVPSAVVPVEFNIVLNPAHPSYADLRIHEPRPFGFDPRLAAKH